MSFHLPSLPGSGSKGPVISRAEFEKWYFKSMIKQMRKRQFENQQKMAEGDYDFLTPPEDAGFVKLVLHYATVPLLFALYITLPDVRKPKSKKYFVVTFVGAIVWVGVFSYLMVSCSATRTHARTHAHTPPTTSFRSGGRPRSATSSASRLP